MTLWHLVLFITLNNAFSCLLSSHDPKIIPPSTIYQGSSNSLLEELRAKKRRCILHVRFLPDFDSPMIERLYWLVSWSDRTIMAGQQQIKTTCGTVMTALTAAVHLSIKEKLLKMNPKTHNCNIIVSFISQKSSPSFFSVTSTISAPSGNEIGSY